MGNIGQIYVSRKQYRLALKFFKEALDIQVQNLGNDHPNLANTISSIAMVYINVGHHSKCLSMFQKALEMRRRLLGPDHIKVAATLYNIGTIHLELGNNDEALELYCETLRIQRKVWGNDHGDLVRIMQIIAFVHEEKGELNEALDYFTKILAIQQQQQSGNDRATTNEDRTRHYTAISQTLNYIGNIHLQKAQIQQMMDAFSDSARYMRIAGQVTNDNVVGPQGMKFYALSKICPECAPVA